MFEYNDEKNINIEFHYILVGNIIDKHFYGETNTIKSGTKHFRAGAKVYLFPEYGGMGHENMPVYGLARKSKRKITVVIRSNLVKNVRIKKIYESKVLQKIKENHFYQYFQRESNGYELMQNFANSMNKINKEICE